MNISTRHSKARQALLQSFSTLVLQRPYNEIHIPDILAQADVSRSTFYEHFRNKDDILRESLNGMLSALSHIGFESEDEELTIRILDHIREYRKLTAVYLNSTITPFVVSALADSVQARIGAMRNAQPQTFDAFQIAESTLGMLRTWLEHAPSLSPEQMAVRIRLTTRALVEIQQD